MKLSDIFEQTTTNPGTTGVGHLHRTLSDYPSFKRTIDNIKSQPSHKLVGTGANAYVHKVDTPHDMDRVHRTSMSHDANTIYLQYITDHPELHNNTYLPRVLAKSTPDSNIVTYQIEKLIPFKTPQIINNDDLMKAMWDRMFNRKYNPGTNPLNIIMDVWSRMESEDVIKDPQLLKAIKIISNLKAMHPGLWYDLHNGNAMWRITGNMPQLVLTDPVSS